MSLDAKSSKLSSVINTSNRIYFYITSVKVRGNEKEGQASFEETKLKVLLFSKTTTKNYFGLEDNFLLSH